MISTKYTDAIDIDELNAIDSAIVAAAEGIHRANIAMACAKIMLFACKEIGVDPHIILSLTADTWRDELDLYDRLLKSEARA